ncbi:MAG: heme o synthase [Planctomycetota bacterium]
MSLEIATSVERSQASRLRLLDYVELTKPRICFLVLVTTAVGFCLGERGTIDGWLLAQALLGTALLGGGSSALNHLLERGPDAHMRRTENRPLPAGRLQPAEVGIFGGALVLLGIATLFLRVNQLTGVLGAISFVSYVFIYTPLKRVTSLNTHVGAIPGALPTVMGFTAARNAFGPDACVLFAILFLWQLPHFLAIAWLYREDYRRAGYPMLPVLDPDGSITGRQVILYSSALLLTSLLPSMFGRAGMIYFFGALGLGLGFLAFGAALAISKSERDARRVVIASVIYLPLLLTLLMIDRI